MKKPWTIRVTVHYLRDSAPRIGYTSGMPRYWTKRGAQKKCDRLNALGHSLAYWKPVRTKKEAW